MVPQQWLANIIPPGVAPEDRRRLDLIVYGATPNEVALCCDATLVTAPTRSGQPAHAADSRNGELGRASRRGRRPLERRGPTVRASTRPAQGGAARRPPCAQQLRRAGCAVDGACWLSRSSVLSAAPSWARGACRRSQETLMPSLWEAS